MHLVAHCGDSLYDAGAILRLLRQGQRDSSGGSPSSTAIAALPVQVYGSGQVGKVHVCRSASSIDFYGNIDSLHVALRVSCGICL